MIYINDTQTAIRFPRTVTVEELEAVALLLVNTTDRRAVSLELPATVEGSYITVGGIGEALEPGEWEYRLETPAGTPLGCGIVRVSNETDFPVQPTVQYDKTVEYEQYFAE